MFNKTIPIATGGFNPMLSDAGCTELAEIPSVTFLSEFTALPEIVHWTASTRLCGIDCFRFGKIEGLLSRVGYRL